MPKDSASSMAENGCCTGQNWDPAERRRTEEALLASEGRFRRFVEQAPIAMAIVGMDGVIEFINRKAVEVFGYRHEDIPDMDRWWVQAYPEEHYRNEVIASWTGLVQKAVAEDTEISGGEYRTTCKDGTVKTVFISGAIVADKVFVLFDDITASKQGEEALRKSEERYRRLVETTDTGYVILDGTGVVLDANTEYLRLSGRTTLKEILGRNVVEWTAAEEKETNAKAVAACMRDGFIRNFEITYVDQAGARTSIEINATMMETNGGKRILSLCRDITRRKKAEEFQKQTSSLLRATLESTADGLLVIDQAGNVASFNNKFGELWRIPKDLLDKGDDNTFLSFTTNQLKHPEAFLAKVKELYAQPHLESFDIIEFKDGRVFERYSRPQRIGDRIAGRVWSFHDVTERIKTEALLANAQKLESLGVLAGGIAHDFNNLLTGIFGYIDLARHAQTHAEAGEYLDATLATMTRARALTLQLLTFAKGGAPILKTTALAPLIHESVQFALSGSNISCRFNLAENLLPCNIDRNQIGQVIDNIVINAQQAMPSGGFIEINAGNISFKTSDNPALTAGDYVMVSIRDSGIGIPKDILPRIFDPFYTTKTKGHGLGLATCYSIITRHGGSIDVESEPGRGSTFHFYLPASAKTVAADATVIARHKGGGLMIVVDDEEVIRTTVRCMLISLGYTVVCRNDGRDAVDFHRDETAAGRRCSGMFFDLTIPGGMGGVEAVAEIRKTDRETPVFVMSGYSDNPVMTAPVQCGFTASICKPFTITELSEMLNTYVKIRT